MEPLVIFGAGLVVYCGYLAAADEIRDIKRWYARHRALCNGKAARTVRNRVRAISDRNRRPRHDRGYACTGSMLASQAR